jgi:hypothetical protein
MFILHDALTQWYDFVLSVAVVLASQIAHVSNCIS